MMFINLVSIILLLITLTIFPRIINCASDQSAKWDIDWHSSDLNFIPPLPIAAPNSKNSKCKIDSIMLINGLKNMTLWAEQMWDASAKAPFGITSGNAYQLGDYDECLIIQVPIEAQYCLADIKIHIPPGHNTTNPYATEYDPTGSVYDKLYYGGSPWKIRMDEVKWALCIPASCSAEDITQAISDHLGSLNYSQVTATVDPKLCTRKVRPYDEYVTSDIIFCTLMLTLISLTFGSTIYDFLLYSGQKDWRWNTEGQGVDFLMCFSARRAVRSMAKKKTVIKHFDLRPLSGITFLSCIIITIGHRWGFRYAGPVQNVDVNESVYYNWAMLFVIAHLDLFVDIFFTVSGCIAVFFILNRMETHKVKFWQIIVVRYFRLTPVYAIVIFFYCTLYYKMGDGPLWNYYVGTDTENCKQVWWTNLLYINNYVYPDQLCGFHTWFMPCEFQFGILVIPLCYLYHSKPKLGLKIAIAALVIAIAIPFYVTYSLKLNGNLIFNAKFFKTPSEDIYFSSFYLKSHTRAGPYIIGTILGYILHNYKGDPLSPKQTWGYGLIGGFIMLVCWASGSIIYYPHTPYNVWFSATYGATIRSIWSFGLSIVLYVMLTGTKTFVHEILSWKPFLPLSAIGFNVYLLNTILPTTTTAALRNPDHLSLLSFVLSVIGDFGLDMFFGFILFLIIERPFRLLGTHVQKLLDKSDKVDLTAVNNLGYENKVATAHL